jgi:hypothetical protein
MTSVDASKDRADAASRWSAFREANASYASKQSDLADDQRVQAAKNAAAAAPTPRERAQAAEKRQRPHSPAKALDVLA